ncbi:MAG: hypothetical protein OEZ36_02950 [Spirochaetota bacterium]|nr:hypothetical protein [Spirochaetota bacterium]
MKDHDSKMDKSISSKEFYYMTDLKGRIKTMKPRGKTPISQIYNKMQQITKNISFLNERLDLLHQKVNGIKKDIVDRVEETQTRSKKVYRGLLISFITLSAITATLAVLYYIF